MGNGLFVHGTRLKESLLALGKLGLTENGVNRLTYSKAFWDSCAYVAKEMENAGMRVQMNAVGNVVGTYPGKSAQKIVMGSHIDSVPNGGMLDGCLGVMAAIEAVRTMHESGYAPEHTLEVAAWAEEEGCVIGGLLGSRAYCGLPLFEVHQKAIAGYGITKADVAACKAEGELSYSLELHIEQGGRLEREKIDIGVVYAIVSIRRYKLVFGGVANHAGTTPMSMRDDALIKAAAFIGRVREVVRTVDGEMVGTVGWLEVQPNSMNIVPGKVSLMLELRAANTGSLDTAYETLMGEFGESIASSEQVMDQPVYRMDQTVMDAIGGACKELGLSSLQMVSGAGHDSMSLAQVTRPGMIFVPSVGGISHSKEERTEWRDVENGANVLLHALLALDKNKISN